MKETKYHWIQLQNNPYFYGISLEQFYGKNPQEKSIKTLLKGEHRGTGGKERIILFDRPYILSYLHKTVFEPLITTQLKVVFTILFKAFFEYCKRTNSKTSLKVYKLHDQYVVRLVDIGIKFDDLKEVLHHDSIGL